VRQLSLLLDSENAVAPNLDSLMMRAIAYCRNPKCRDRLMIGSTDWFCLSCRTAGKLGMFFGGLVVGLVAAFIKLIG